MDLETLCFGRDGKVACETFTEPPPPLLEDDVYLSSMSFEAPAGWSGSSLTFRTYSRKESTKAPTNPKSGAQHTNPKSRTSSERFSPATANPSSKPPIIGLPTKIQTSRYDGRSVRRPTQGRIFPKKGGRGAEAKKSKVPEPDPGSPKVSCFGKVLSDRERERERRRREQQLGAPTVQREVRRRHWANFAADVFMCRCRHGGGKEAATELQPSGTAFPPSGRSVPQKKVSRAATVEQLDAGKEEPPSAPAPGIGGLTRFSSGRRAASWGEEMELKSRRLVSLG